MTRFGNEPRSPGPLANTLTIMIDPTILFLLAGRKIVGFVPFPNELGLCEMQLRSRFELV